MRESRTQASDTHGVGGPEPPHRRGPRGCGDLLCDVDNEGVDEQRAGEPSHRVGDENERVRAARDGHEEKEQVN